MQAEPIKRLLVVVPVINLWERYTKPMLESLKCSLMPWDVLLIDNGSTDSTPVSSLELAKEWEARETAQRLMVLRNNENLGCAAAWNMGLKYAGEHNFSHILICNNDILLNEHTIDGMITRMEKGGVELVSSVDVSGELTNAPAIKDMTVKDETESPHPNFSCFLITDKTVEKVGNFDEGFKPAYFEDNDYHYRIKLAGGLAIANTKSVFYHYGSRTQNESGGMPVVTGSAFEKNRLLYVQKWGGAPCYETFTKPFNK